jgi:hypothetical protein
VSKMSRTKGAVFEREVVRLIREAGWTSARRTSDGRVQHGRGDVMGGPGGVHIECKRQERLNVPAAFQQIARDAAPTDIPVLIHRPSRCELMATLPLDELLALLKHREAA